MPIPTPFHRRTAPLCESYLWRDWAGYAAVRRYGSCHQPEYLALRHACGLIDVSPLFKYLVEGPHAERFLSHALCRDVRRLAVDRVAYSTWCDDTGRILDDGTVARLAADRFRVTSAEPSFAWFSRLARGFEVQITDVTSSTAALAVQGPTSRRVVASATDVDLDGLRFFGRAVGRLRDMPVEITRTGYTGDLGYELWFDAALAVPVWDTLVEHGRNHGLLPVGLDALDMTRIEAGFVLQGIDYLSARDCTIHDQTSSPFELGLGWTVHLGRGSFVGSTALEQEQASGSCHALVGLEVDWSVIEGLFRRKGLPPDVAVEAWRDPRPVRLNGLRGSDR